MAIGNAKFITVLAFVGDETSYLVALNRGSQSNAWVRFSPSSSEIILGANKCWMIFVGRKIHLNFRKAIFCLPSRSWKTTLPCSFLRNVRKEMGRNCLKPRCIGGRCVANKAISSRSWSKALFSISFQGEGRIGTKILGYPGVRKAVVVFRSQYEIWVKANGICWGLA
jgi:hypothetical protein